MQAHKLLVFGGLVLYTHQKFHLICLFGTRLTDGLHHRATDLRAKTGKILHHVRRRDVMREEIYKRYDMSSLLDRHPQGDAQLLQPLRHLFQHLLRKGDG